MGSNRNALLAGSSYLGPNFCPCVTERFRSAAGHSNLIKFDGFALAELLDYLQEEDVLLKVSYGLALESCWNKESCTFSCSVHGLLLEAAPVVVGVDASPFPDILARLNSTSIS